MSKKIKFLIIIILITVAIGLIFGISTFYRFSVIENIQKTVKENIAKNNYYLKTTVSNKGKNTVTETYYKDGIGKLVAENGIYTWADGKDAYIVDENNKEIRVLDINKALGLVSNEMFASLYPCYSDGIFERFLFAGNMNNKIKKVKLNDEKCIVIQKKEETNTKTIWISASRNNIIKAKIEFPNGDIFEYDYELKFNITRLKNIELPDISEYKVIKEDTGEVILDNTNNENQ